MDVLNLQFDDQQYPVWIGIRCSNRIIANLRHLEASSYHIVTDQTVSQLHANAIFEQLSTQACAKQWVIAEGESCKRLGTVESLAVQMVEAGIDRASVIVAVGGGAVGNLAGLLAALLFRGIRLVHVPTTLIAAADSVASLKQAVNLPLGKNLLGCFHKPTAVMIDICFLQTLPPPSRFGLACTK